MNEIQAAEDAFVAMDEEERSYALIDVRSAIAVGSRLDALDGGNRRELEEKVLEVYLKVIGHYDRSKSMRCLH